MSTIAAAVRAGVAEATVLDAFASVTVDVPRESWVPALTAAYDGGATYFDFLTAYDELAAGFVVVVHASTPDAHDHVLVRARLPRDDASIATAVAVYRGASWHERETHEMFGVTFTGTADDAALLLPPGFSGHPLRKDFVLASRVAKPWPGDKDPADSTGKPRRRTLPPGVPAEWPAQGDT